MKLDLSRFTPSQKEAIVTDGKNIIVSAGAGSGKTEVLTNRVAYFISEKSYKLEDFLVLTFTEAAAEEMKGRIRELLVKIGSEEANKVDISHISTFDSYALFLVKKYHQLLNLANDLSIVDTSVINVIKHRFIDEILEGYYNKGNETFISLVSKTCFKDDNLLKSLILKLYSNATLDFSVKNYLTNYVNNLKSDKYLESLKNTILLILLENTKILEKRTYELPENYIKSKNMTYQEAIREVLQSLFECSSLEEFSEYVPIDRFPSLPNKTDEDEKINKDFKDFYNNNIKKILELLPKDDEELQDLVLENEDELNVLIEICLKLDEKLNKYKEKYHVYEFVDIQKAALNCLKDHEDIRNELSKELKMILIDEYQDTSIMQENFINLIEKNNLYMVGDVKQSIYRFRDARCDIFIDKYNRYKKNDGGYAIDLVDNFRSRSDVVDDFNKIFSTIMSDKVGGANYKKDHIINAGNPNYKLYPTSYDNHLDIFTHPKLKAADTVDYEARIIAEDIIDKMNNHYQIMGKDGLRDVCFADFCILIDRGTHFETFSKIFNEYQIPLAIVANEEIQDNLLILILKNLVILLKSIDNNDYQSFDFRRSFTSIARSFIYDLSDNEIYQIFNNSSPELSKVSRELKGYLDKYSDLPLTEKLERIIFDLHIYEKLILIGDLNENERYLDTFIDLFKNMNLVDYDYDDFISFLDNVKDLDIKINLTSSKSDLDSVFLMNIHKSKGLGFSICYYPLLSTAFNRSDITSGIKISRTNGLIIADTDETLINIIDKYQNIMDDTSERIRLFYVALTRSKEKVILVMNEDDFKKSPASLSLAKSLYDFMSYDNLYLFFRRMPKEIEKKTLKIKNQNQVNKKLEIHEFNIETSIKESKRASKALSMKANLKNLELGTKLHFLLEITDFDKPDYSIMTLQEASYLKKFLESGLIDYKNNPKYYKEYEYYDKIIEKEEIIEIRGIIDLMVEYSDHIDIIDYKTKHIEDEEYDNQLNTYRNHIKMIFNKPVKCYLYSIVEGISREVINNE